MTAPLTAEQREELRRLEAAATPGPWSHDNRAKGTEGDPCLFTESGPSYSPGKSPIFTAPAFWTAADGDLCAAARNALPALLEAADRAEELERLLTATAEGLTRVEEFVSNEWHVTALDAVQELLASLALELRPQPKPSNERRDEQGKAEQLVGSGDGPNDRDDR
jgi:hypothetical protein